MLKVQKVLSKQEALVKAMNFCAYQERCTFEVKKRLEDWEVKPEFIDSIIKRLEDEKFLNEKRFAAIYADSKFRLKHWGKLKIRNELANKQIPDALIEKGIKAIDGPAYHKKLKELLKKKKKKLTEKDPFKLKEKLARYVIAKGYEPELVWNLLKKSKI